MSAIMTSDTEPHKVALDVFEGPLDLLLYLIRKDELNIYDIPIESVTRQYLEYLSLMQSLDLNVAGEFIVMAATLMMIKSRMLLPVEERPPDEEDEEDPRAELVRQLVEYKRFKDAACELQKMELHQENVFGLGGALLAVESPGPYVMLQDVSLFDLIRALGEVLRRAPESEQPEIVGPSVTVADRIQAILEILAQRTEVRFEELFRGDASRLAIVCSFVALLELIRLHRVSVRQEQPFGEIWILARTRGRPEDDEAPPPDGEEQPDETSSAPALAEPSSNP
jgi:segregation and condensation protein A